MTSCGFRFELADGFGARLDDLAPDLDQLVVPRVEHVLTTLARRYALQEVVALLEHAPEAGDGSRIARLDLDQHLVEEPAPQLGAALDQAQIVGPEQRHPEVAGQVDRPPACPVDLDRPTRAPALDIERDRQLPPGATGLHLGLDPRGGAARRPRPRPAGRPPRPAARAHRDPPPRGGGALRVLADGNVGGRAPRRRALRR